MQHVATLSELADALEAAGVGVYLCDGAARTRWLAGAASFGGSEAGARAGAMAADAPPGEIHRVRDALAAADETVMRLPDGPGGAPRFCGVVLRASGDSSAGGDWLSRRDGRSGLQAHLTHLGETLDAGAQVAICAIGVDGMREFSRVYGYEAGDALSRAIGDRIMRAAPRGAACARIGGATFAVALASACGAGFQRDVEAMAADIRAGAFDVGFGPVSATVSIGVAIARPGALGQPEPFDAALAALDEARAEGESGLFVSDPDSGDEATSPAAMRAGAAAVMRALEGDRVAIAFQPIVSSANPHPVAFRECLARVRDDDGRWLPAALFLPKIERLDLVRALDRRMLRLALATLSDHPTERLSVNVSVRTMRDRRWVGDLAAAAAAEPGVAERLIVELTESAAVTDAARTKAFLDEIRALGVAIALDDFGAGYSSFRLLRDFRPDWVKIDGAFVRGVSEDPDNKLFVDTLVGIARNFDMATVAEFVETEEDAITLRALGVDCLQGYRFGRPEIAPDWSRARFAESADG